MQATTQFKMGNNLQALIIRVYGLPIFSHLAIDVSDLPICDGKLERLDTNCIETQSMEL
jgi:hypothetical protein